MASKKKIVDPTQPHAPRTWQAQQGVKAGQYGDKKAAFRLPTDLCLICGQLRDHALHQ